MKLQQVCVPVVLKQLIIFIFGSIWVERYNKTLTITTSMGNSEFYFPLTLRVDSLWGSKTYCLPWSQSSVFKSRKACETIDIAPLVHYVAMSCLFQHIHISSVSLQVSSRNTVTLLVSQYIWMAHALTPFRFL